MKVTTPSLPLLMQPCQNQQFFLNVCKLHSKRKTQQTNFNHILGYVIKCPWKRNSDRKQRNLSHLIIISFSPSYRSSNPWENHLLYLGAPLAQHLFKYATSQKLPQKLRISEYRETLAAVGSAACRCAFQDTPCKATQQERA